MGQMGLKKQSGSPRYAMKLQEDRALASHLARTAESLAVPDNGGLTLYGSQLGEAQL